MGNKPNNKIHARLFRRILVLKDEQSRVEKLCWDCRNVRRGFYNGIALTQSAEKLFIMFAINSIMAFYTLYFVCSGLRK